MFSMWNHIKITYFYGWTYHMLLGHVKVCLSCKESVCHAPQLQS